MAKIKLLDLIDFNQVNLLLDGFNKTTGFVTAILDLDGNILSQSGWRGICVNFHRVHKETQKKCTLSDTMIANKLANGADYHSYQCLNGLIDVAVPLKVHGIHIANIFSGQFFYENPDKQYFIDQAKKYGFDEEEYIKSMEQVPIVSKEKVKLTMDFLLNMTLVISEMTQQKMEQLELTSELKKSEERWQYAIEGNGDGLWDWNVKKDEVFFSKQWKNMLGYNETEVEHSFNGWDRLVHPDDKEQAQNDIQSHINGNKSEYLNEHRLLCKDGSYKWIRARGRIISRDKDNKPIRFIGTHVDINDYKESQEKLLEHQFYLTKAQAIGKIGTWELDIKANSLHWTDQNYKNFDLPLGSKLSYETFLNRVHPDDRDYVDTEWKAALNGKPYDIEHRILTKDKVKWIREKCDVEFDENNKAIYAIGFSQDITERKISEEVIKESEAIYRNLVEVMPDGVYKSTEEGRFVEVNQALVDMLAYDSKEELMSIDIKNQLYFEIADRESVVLKEKQEQKGIYRMKKKDGSEIWVEDHGWLNYDEKTETLYHEGIMRDITQRKYYEEELLKLSTAVEQSPSVIAITDRNGFIEYVNPQFTLLTGFTLEEAKSTKTFIISSAHTKEQEKEIWATINSGKIWRGDIFNQKKNGEDYWESVTISPVFNETANITNFLKLSKDVSEQKQLEKAHKTILEISQISDQNTTLYDFLANVHEKVKSIIRAENFFMAFFHKESNTYTFPYYKDEIDHCEPKEHFKIENGYTDLVRQKGKTILITEESKKQIWEKHSVKSYGDKMAIWLGIPVKMSNQKEVIGVIVVQDYHNLNAYSASEIATLEIIVNNIGVYIERVKYLDEILKAKEKAEESDRLKSAFLANMSHEIRTPMNGILGFSDLLKEPDLSGEEQKTYIEVIERAGHRMLNIINDIVDISKIESGQMEAVIKDTNVNEQTEFIYNFFKAEVERKGLHLSLNNTLPHSSVHIKTDTEKLYAILTNLVKNAIKYTRDGSIEFGYHLKENFLEFYVKDTGIGIPKERQKAVFERFIQADIANKMAQDGAGLGLAISKAYVNMLGGEIWGNSKSEEISGKSGSVFYFTIPYATN